MRSRKVGAIVRLGKRGERLILLVVILLYLVLGGLYAVKTPIWQVPDEPAHYNYIRFIAENGTLPVLVQGDFPAEWLSVLKMFKFTGMSIDRVKYESHQPPLYYLLGTPFYLLANKLGLPEPLVLRLMSLLIGAIALWFGYRLVRTIFQDEPWLALGTAAFAATLPMHLTMAMGINNDVLAELMLAIVVGQLVMGGFETWSYRRSALLGVLLGLAMLTKLQAYVAVAVILAAFLWDYLASRTLPGRFPFMKGVTQAAIVFGVAFLIVLPWLIRNASIYGITDILAQKRQAEVASSQLNTAAYIRQVGLKAYAVAFITTTFKSFWGQFGWMGVVLHPRFYLAALLLSGLVGTGFIIWFFRAFKRKGTCTPNTWRGLFLLAIWSLATLAGFIWYNTHFVQFQGRYLFPAIVPIGLAFTIGFRELFKGKQVIPFLVVGLVVTILLIDGVLQKNVKVFSTVMSAAIAPLLLVGKQVEKRVPGVMIAGLYSLFSVYSLYCLFAYIVPELTF